jgi:hypothetical protein
MASGNFAPLIGLGLSDNFGMEYKEVDLIYPQLYHVKNTNSRYVDVQGWEGYQLPFLRNPRETVQQSQFRASFAKRFIVAGYTIVDVLAQEDIDDDQYGCLVRWASSRGGQLAKVYSTLEERLAADYFATTGFSATSPAPDSPDGVSLFSTSHPMSESNTQTWSNRPAAGADLSMATFQAGRANLEQQFDPNGVTILANRVKSLVVNPNYKEIALQICKSDWVPGTADRNMNTIKDMNVEVISWPYFRKTGATAATNAFNGWFMQGETHHMYWYNREDVVFDDDKDVYSRSLVFTSHRRFTLGEQDPRGMYGSPGS